MKVAKPEDFQPLSETTLYILLSLAPGPLHGYAIAKEVRPPEREPGGIECQYALYHPQTSAGGRLDRAGGGGSAPELTGRPRKTYALTERGQRLLTQKKRACVPCWQCSRNSLFGEEP